MFVRQTATEKGSMNHSNPTGHPFSGGMLGNTHQHSLAWQERHLHVFKRTFSAPDEVLPKPGRQQQTHQCYRLVSDAGLMSEQHISLCIYSDNILWLGPGSVCLCGAGPHRECGPRPALCTSLRVTQLNDCAFPPSSEQKWHLASKIRWRCRQSHGAPRMKIYRCCWDLTRIRNINLFFSHVFYSCRFLFVFVYSWCWYFTT